MCLVHYRVQFVFSLACYLPSFPFFVQPKQLFIFHIICSDYEEILESGILYQSEGFTEHSDYLYWTDAVDGSIRVTEKDPPYETRKLVLNRQYLKDINVFHRNRQQPGHI